MDMITSIQSSTSGWFNQGGPSVDMITSTQSSTSGWFNQGGPSVDMITPIQSSTFIGVYSLTVANNNYNLMFSPHCLIMYI